MKESFNMPPRGWDPQVEDHGSRGMFYMYTWFGHTFQLSAFVMKRENLAQWNTGTRREGWALIFTSPLTDDDTLNHSPGFATPQLCLLEYTNYLALMGSSTVKYLYITVVRQWIRSLQMGELNYCVPIKANFSHIAPSL